MTLLMVGRHPELFAAGAAFCPISDLAQWWRERSAPGARWHNYARNLVAACGGTPDAATDEDRKRSPITHLPAARAAGVPVNIVTGIHDGHTGSVPVGHALRAFNALADAGDAIPEDAIKRIEADEKVPAGLVNESCADPFYAKGREVLFRRTSGNARVTLFEGGHGGNFNAFQRLNAQDMHLAAREAQIDPEYASFQVLLMRGCQDVFSDMLQELAKNDTVDGYGMAMLHNNQYMIVIFAADTKAISPVVDSIFALGESRREFILATSKIHRCYEEAPEAYLEANASLNGFLLIDNQKIICYDDILDESRMVDIPPSYLQNLKYAVLRQEKQAVKTAILEIGSCIKARHYTLVAVQLLYVDIIRSLTKEYCNEEEIFSQVFDVFLLSKCVTIQDFCELLSDVCLRLIDQQKENRSENAEALVKAVAYVEENYGDSNLSVSVLADHLNLSQAALTAMFKQSMRMNPSDYLRMIRMEKAKKLLSDTDMLVKDIASAVGYADSRVFVKRFKSNVGMTPVEYRKQS